MATPTRILDEQRFESRARIADVFALLTLVAMGAALVYDMYTFGFTAADLARSVGSVVERDQVFVRMLGEAFVAAIAFCWVAYRLLSGTARRVGG